MNKVVLTFTAHIVCAILFIAILTQCETLLRGENLSKEVLQSPGFRLLQAPQEVISWEYHYANRTFSLPDYRTPGGAPLPGWRCQVVATRRFFTDQSARIYYRTEDLRRTRRFKSVTPSGGTSMMIWPVGTILVLETYSEGDAYRSDAAPVAVDCIQKFAPEPARFPVHVYFAGDWCYQRFSVTGERRKMIGGASACHQCHRTAFHLTGDLVFTLFSDDAGGNGCN